MQLICNFWSERISHVKFGRNFVKFGIREGLSANTKDDKISPECIRVYNKGRLYIPYNGGMC